VSVESGVEEEEEGKKIEKGHVTHYGIYERALTCGRYCHDTLGRFFLSLFITLSLHCVKYKLQSQRQERTISGANTISKCVREFNLPGFR